MQTMNDYTIYCTPDQTHKALELGAPIRNFITKEESKRLVKISQEENRVDDYEKELVKYYHQTIIGDMIYCIPTAEQMLGWLEEQGLELRVIKQRYRDGTFAYVFTMIDNDGYFKPHKNNMVYTNRKEATLAAIVSALEYLISKKK